jgi:hypothetical protein
MTLGNMRKLVVKRLVAYCLRDAGRHVGLIDVSKYPDDTEVCFEMFDRVQGNHSLLGEIAPIPSKEAPRRSDLPTGDHFILCLSPHVDERYRSAGWRLLLSHSPA